MPYQDRFLLDFMNGAVVVKAFDELWTEQKYVLPGEESALTAAEVKGNLGRIVQTSPANVRDGIVSGSGILAWDDPLVDPWTAPRELKAILQGFDVTEAWHSLTKRFEDPYGNVWGVEPIKFDGDFVDLHGEAFSFQFTFAVTSAPTVLQGPCD